MISLNCPGYSVLTWPDGLPYLELNCSLGLNGAVFLLLPIFFTVTILKVVFYTFQL